MDFQFLGTGNAAQVPCYGCHCAACERARNVIDFRRTPCSAKIQTEQGTLLLDAGQTNLAERFPVECLAAVLLTHYHMDHVQGLFHLRWGKNSRLPIFGPDDEQGCDDLYKHPGILCFEPAPALFHSFSLLGLEITPVPLNHSKPCVGYYITDGSRSVAYLTDTLGLPQETVTFLQSVKLEVLVVDCSYPPIPAPKNHNSLTEALAIVEQLQPQKTYLTHIGHDLDCFLLSQDYSLPANIFLAKDNQRIFKTGITLENTAAHYA
jgi:phosphoribosyl 1,2-cyclic phosphate phosphodiesterase